MACNNVISLFTERVKYGDSDSNLYFYMRMVIA